MTSYNFMWPNTYHAHLVWMSYNAFKLVLFPFLYYLFFSFFTFVLSIILVHTVGVCCKILKTLFFIKFCNYILSYLAFRLPFLPLRFHMWFISILPSMFLIKGIIYLWQGLSRVNYDFCGYFATVDFTLVSWVCAIWLILSQ